MKKETFIERVSKTKNWCFVKTNRASLVAQVVKNPECESCGFDPWIRKIPCRTAWQPIPVFLPGESHGQRSLLGYSPWGHKESDTTERLSTQRPIGFKILMQTDEEN